MVNVKPRTSPESRLWSKVEKTDDCWLWVGAVAGGRPGNRYGVIGETRDKMVYVHRLSWEMHHGPIPDGRQVLHRCDTPLCVRPDHLFLGSLRDNMADMVAKNRQASGERNANHRLTAEDIRAIRESDEDQPTTARRYGISQPTVSNIRRRVTWASVE